MLRRRLLAGVLALGCGLPAVAAAAAGGVWLDVPFVRQQKDGCGAASLAMVMQYWQRRQAQPASADAQYSAIQQALLSRAAHGIYASSMAGYLRQNGFAAYAFTGDTALLEHHLAEGRPLIVALQPSWRADLHYVVVAGIDPQAGVVFVNDPAERKLLKEDLGRFKREWKATGNWTLLALPADGGLHQ